MPTGGVETCATVDDDECDGTECGLWGRLYGDGANQLPRMIDVAPNGDIYVVGTLGASGAGIQFAGQFVASTAADQQFLAKLSASGKELWIKTLPSQSGSGFYNILGATADRVIIQTFIHQPIDLGGGSLQPTGNDDMALVSFGADGGYQWATQFSSPQGNVLLYAHDLSPLNQLVAAGWAETGAAYQGTVFTPPMSTESRNWFGLAINLTNGAMVWHRDFQVDDLANNDQIRTLGCAPNGDIYLGGYLYGPMTFGGPPLQSSDGWTNGYIAHLDPNGNWVDGGFIGDNVYPRDIDVGPGGEIIVTAEYSFYQLGGQSVPFNPGYAMMRLSTQYQPAWVQFMNEEISADVDANGIGFVVGKSGVIKVGGASFPAHGTIDLVAGRVGYDGVMQWYRQFGAVGALIDDVSPSQTFRLQPDNKAVMLFKASGGAVNFGFGPLAPAGTNDIGIVQLAM